MCSFRLLQTAPPRRRFAHSNYARHAFRLVRAMHWRPARGCAHGRARLGVARRRTRLYRIRPAARRALTMIKVPQPQKLESARSLIICCPGSLNTWGISANASMPQPHGPRMSCPYGLQSHRSTCCLRMPTVPPFSLSWSTRLLGCSAPTN